MKFFAKRRNVVLLIFAFAMLATAVAVPQIRWRVLVVALKCAGQLGSVEWKELAMMLQPDSGVPLRALAGKRNPFAVISDPFESAADQAAGKTLFAANCARCHGDGASGGAGPALVGRMLKIGDSDWAMFHTITHGVPGTAMPAWSLKPLEVWRIIGYLRGLSDRATIAGQSAGLAVPIKDVSIESLHAAGTQPGDWLLSQGSYNGQRFARDDQINTGNVASLAVKWVYQFGTTDDRNESVPIVAGDRMYVTHSPATLIALNARNGKRLWEYTRTLPSDLRLCCLNANRGVAVSGNRVYMGTLDAHLLAFDAATGKILWDKEVAPYKVGYSITSAPLIVDDMVVTGIAGGDFPTRGFITAYDAVTGAQKWRTYSIPGAGEPGVETWGGDNWRVGGVSTWGIGSYDPELGLIYWGTGNAAAVFDTRDRPGDDLYSNSVIALDKNTGKLAWYFQFSPGDDHDWDSNQTPILIDGDDPDHKKLLAVANRNGFFYVLDRTNGKFLRAAPYVKQTWASGISDKGRPIRIPNTSPSPTGVFIYPSVSGATNFWPAAYSPATQRYYVMALERGGLFFTPSDMTPTPGKIYGGSGGRFVDDDVRYTAIKAIDPATGKVTWEHRNATFNDWPRGGVLATAGGLVFGADTTSFIALNAATGEQLWSFQAGDTICAAPISYRIGDRQVIAVVAGQVLLTFVLPDIALQASAQRR